MVLQNAEISITTEFLEELHPWSKKEEKRIFIVPSQLPEDKGEKRLSFDKGEKRLSFVNKKRVWSIHFAFTDGFISLTLFHQMVAAYINWNGKRKQNIQNIQNGQFYCVSLCKANSSIQLDIILDKGTAVSAKNRKELLKFFQTTLEQIRKEFMVAATKPTLYVNCPYCTDFHIKYANLLKGGVQICKTVTIPQDYYQDLFKNIQGNYKYLLVQLF